jgi:TolA-binding protein
MKKNLFIFILYIAPVLFLHGVYANEGLDVDSAILKINKEVKSLNKEILSLKDEIELIQEGQRINSRDISELLQIIELNLSNNKKAENSTNKIQAKNANKLYSDGKNEFALGNYDQAITLFISFAKSSPDSPDIKDSKLWLARAYSASEAYLKAKDAFLDYQSNNKKHLNYADSMFELSRVLAKLNEINDAKLLLSDMIQQYPSHSLINKANQLLSDL